MQAYWLRLTQVATTLAVAHRRTGSCACLFLSDRAARRASIGLSITDRPEVALGVLSVGPRGGGAEGVALDRTRRHGPLTPWRT